MTGGSAGSSRKRMRLAKKEVGEDVPFAAEVNETVDDEEDDVEDEEENDSMGDPESDDMDEDDDSEGEHDDSDGDGDIRDYRKRLKRGRKPVVDPPTVTEPAGGEAGEGAGDNEEGLATTDMPPVFVSDGTYRNKQRVLLFSSRGITSRYRHLLEDLRKLIPHHKKDVKLDVGRKESLASAVNEIAEVKSCNSCLFLECRKKMDLYLWAGKTPNGPSVKFSVLNVHTMDELKLTGNCMLGSRPLLNFDTKFDQVAHWRLIKGILTDIFATPRGHPKSKPFVDRVMSFYVADGKIWVRNYQIMDKGDGGVHAKRMEKAGGDETVSLVEIGPRFVLNPIRIFAGSFGGPTLYTNSAYVSANEARSARKRTAGRRYEERTESKRIVKEKKSVPAVPRGELDDVFLG